jgi:hypothetical protein
VRIALAVLLTTMTAAVLGCNSPILHTDYDGHSDVITCSVINEWDGSSSRWTEKGYTCHANPTQRVRP